ncbi:hypothetical protein [Butyrivibrio sp. MC2021]|uniref:hypothetical protein n=1 Tax=Butyrivibrio sp. MC2021 TaxID=1408306 RepID=UPI000478DF90|nr:hypothetical protein [Butyrivibrio sp. MC2021]
MNYRKIIALALTFSTVIAAMGCSNKEEDDRYIHDSARIPYIGGTVVNYTTAEFVESYEETPIVMERHNYNITLYENEHVPFMENAEKVRESIYAYDTNIPRYVPEENFVAYFAFEGSSSVCDHYLVFKEDGQFKVRKESFNCGDSTFYYGTIDNVTYFLEEFAEKDPVQYVSNDLAGGEESYGVIVYESRGKIYATVMANIFAEN